MPDHRHRICPRQHFIAFVKGHLLTNEFGVITELGDAAGDHVAAVERGETVYLTIGGDIVSRISQKDDAYVEERWEGRPE